MLPSHPPSLPPSLPPSGSHTDLAKGTAPHYKGAVKHYASLAERAVSASHVIDIFACSLDQVRPACPPSLPPSVHPSLPPLLSFLSFHPILFPLLCRSMDGHNFSLLAFQGLMGKPLHLSSPPPFLSSRWA